MNGMKGKERDIQRALSAVYRKREEMSLDERWERTVMGRIRSMEPLAAPAYSFLLAFRALWRFAPVTVILILILSAVLIGFDFNPEYEVTKTFLTNPVEYRVDQLWGV